jgi:hypothetical protein
VCHEISLETDHQREEEGKSGASNVLSPIQTSMVQLQLTEDLRYVQAGLPSPQVYQ